MTIQEPFSLLTCKHELHIYRESESFGDWRPCILKGKHEIHFNKQGISWRTGESGDYKKLPEATLVETMADPSIEHLKFRDEIREKKPL